MKNDTKGIGGLVESMAAAMIVVVSLTVFMGLVCCVQLGEEQEKEDYDFIEKLTIRNGEIVGDIREDIIYVVESEDHVGMEVRVSVIGDAEKLTFCDSYGKTGTDNISTKNGTFQIKSDDGRSLLAGYDVIIWD